MHITRRLGHRAYQRIRAEHLAEEARRASWDGAGEDAGATEANEAITRARARG